MSSQHDEFPTRRKVLAVAGSTSLLGLAGCIGGDDEEPAGSDDTESAGDGSGETGTENGEESTVSLLVEGVAPDHDHDYAHDGLPLEEIEHSCSHLEFDEREPLTGSSTAEDAPAITATHQPYDVTFTGDSGYVKFELDEDEHEHEDGEHEDEHEHEDEEHEHEHEDEEHEDEHEHEESAVSTFELIDRNHDEVTAYVDGDHWHGSLPHIDEGEHISLGAHIEDDHGDEIELDGDHYELRVAVAHDAAEDVVSFDYHGDHVHIIGEHEGQTEVVFQLYHDDHVEYETPSLTAEVTHGEHEDEHEHDDGHEHEYDDEHDQEDEDHDHGNAEMLAFFTEHGSVEVVTGEEIYTETTEVDGCGPMDRYVLLTPDHDEAIVKLSPDL